MLRGDCNGRHSSRMQIDQHNPKTQSKSISKVSQNSSKSTNSQIQSQNPSKSQLPQMSQIPSSQDPSKPTGPPALREVVVGTRTGVSMVIPLKLDDSQVKAVVDSGAQATVMSDEFYRSHQESTKDK